MTSSPFSNAVVVVTGASRGIGQELANQLAKQSACLALAARYAARLEQVAAECRQRGGKALVVPADVTDPGQCEDLVARSRDCNDDARQAGTVDETDRTSFGRARRTPSD